MPARSNPNEDLDEHSREVERVLIGHETAPDGTRVPIYRVRYEATYKPVSRHMQRQAQQSTTAPRELGTFAGRIVTNAYRRKSG